MGKILFFVLTNTVLFSLYGCTEQASQAPPPPAFKTVTGTHEIMEGLIAPAADVVWKSVGTIVTIEGIEDIRPKDDVEWEVVEHSALGLAESANLLLMGNRLIDNEDWVKFSHEMSDTSVVAAKAAEAKDADALLVAGSQIYEACTACHMKYIQ
jgi:hypothetical protein